MKKTRPYSYNLDDHHRRIINRKQLKQQGKTVLEAAGEALRYAIHNTTLIVQSFAIPSFLIELFEIDTEQPVHIDFQMHEQKLFLFIMLQGRITFQSNDGRTVEAQPGHLKLSFFNPGIYQAIAHQGHHLAIAISMPTEWTSWTVDSMQPINEFIRNHQNIDTSYCSFPQVKLNTKATMLLDKILSYNSPHPGIMDAHIRKLTALLLEYYSMGINQRYKEPAYRVFLFLNENFLIPELSLSYLEDRFKYSARAITYHFKKEFGITPQQYYIRLRMLHAKKLSEQQGFSPESLFAEVGYKNPNSFRVAYKKFLSSLKK